MPAENTYHLTIRRPRGMRDRPPTRCGAAPTPADVFGLAHFVDVKRRGASTDLHYCRACKALAG